MSAIDHIPREATLILRLNSDETPSGNDEAYFALIGDGDRDTVVYSLEKDANGYYRRRHESRHSHIDSPEQARMHVLEGVEELKRSGQF